MKNKKLLILVLFLSLFSLKVSAQDLCSKNGYTILTINGIFTNESGALLNRNALRFKLSDPYNNQPIIVDYVYNPTHLGGLGDLVDSARQGLFDPKSDYDLVEMIDDASYKVKTQKILLVGHSQGNFYANSFYNKVSDMEGGVPSQSIGMYGVASPDTHVSGGGKYLTSDTDKVIVEMVGRLKNILTPNTHIELKKEDGNGHSFSDVYLKYRSNQIVSDVKSSLDKLKTNSIQSIATPCLSPRKISLAHKINGIILASGDFVVSNGIKAIKYTYNSVTSTTKSLASSILGLGKRSLALVGFADSQDDNPIISEPSVDNIPQVIIETTPEIITPEIGSEQEDINVTNENINNNDYISSDNILNNNSSADMDSPTSIISGGGHYEDKTNEDNLDKVAPVITLIGEKIITVYLNEIYIENGASALDDKDGIIAVVNTGSVDTSTLGIYEIKYTATDLAMNTNEVVRTVNVVEKLLEDKIPPVITLIGEKIINIELNSVYTESGATALDDKDGIINVVNTGSVDTATLGVYEIKYAATDSALNVSEIIRTINVIEKPVVDTLDKIAPVITLIGESVINVELNSVYVESGATAIDDKDGDVDVLVSGLVDTLNLGVYTIDYTAKDIASNTNKISRIVNVINSNPILSTTSQILIPISGTYKSDAFEPNLGRNNLTLHTSQVIFYDSNNNPPRDVIIKIKNKNTGVYLSDVSMSKIELGSGLFSDGNYINGEIFTQSSFYDIGDYVYSFIAHDKYGNFSKINETVILKFTVLPSSYTYVPKYTFGTENGDNRDWQVWVFNGSLVYGWSDVYVDNYLREQFKLQTNKGGFKCGDCLQRGIFNHDPKKGFEYRDVIVNGLEHNPQNNSSGITYDVVIQWDSMGYTYTIYHGDIVDFTSHINVTNMNNNLWVGWDGSKNHFQSFPFSPDSWQGIVGTSIGSMTGGSSMVLTPYPIYNKDAINVIPAPIPKPLPVVIKSSENFIDVFNFDSLDPQVIGAINNVDNTISLTVPFGTDIKNLIPSIVLSDKASILPENLLVKDFTNAVSYTVTAEDLTTRTYTVSVVISPNSDTDPDSEPNPGPIIPDNLPLDIKSYSINNNQNSITTNPIAINTSIFIEANKKVDWVSLKIEKESDTSFYKIFYSGEGCVDNTTTCSKDWDGELSSGGLLQNGNYKIKVHMKDAINNEYEKYLDSIITVIGQSI